MPDKHSRRRAVWHRAKYISAATVAETIPQFAGNTARHYGLGRLVPWICFSAADSTDQRNACSTFNLLTEEGRRVAAAVLTLAPLDSRSGMPLD